MEDLYPPRAIPDRIILTMEDDPATSMSVTWRTDTTITKGVARISVADASPDFRKNASVVYSTTTRLETDANVAHYHTVTFKKLKPETQYAYRVGSREGWSEWFQFTTASKAKKPISFIYFGDAQNDLKSLWSRAIRGAFVKLPEADFMLHAGDLINNCKNDAEWGEWFYAGGWMYGMIPSLATPGNHEYYRTLDGEKKLTKYWNPSFAFPQNGPRGFKETVYYIDYQGVRFISLDTRAMQAKSENIDIQAEWLENVLSRSKNKWVIVMQHHPIYSLRSGRDNPEMREKLEPLYNKYQVDLVLQGHDHTYGRGKNIPEGMNILEGGSPVYVVSISGPKMYDLSTSDWMDRVASNTQLFQTINIDGDTLTYKAFLVTGELYDSFALIKRKNDTNDYIDLAPESVPELTDLPPIFLMEYDEQRLAEYNRRFKRFKAKQQNRKGDKK
ncbi:MAG: metallophosphoesterase family protein [Bacteroidota bacterium]